MHVSSALTLDIPLVFVSDKYSGDFDENVRIAEELCIAVADAGAVPVCLITSLRDRRFMEVKGYEFWIAAAFSLMNKCRAIVFTHNYDQSSGALREHARAQDIGLPRFYSAADLKIWIEEGLGH